MNGRMPRVLMVHGYMMQDDQNATALTIRNLFGNWDQDSIAQVVCRFSPTEGPNVYWLGSRQIALLNYYPRAKRSDRRKTDNVDYIPGSSKTSKQSITQAVKKAIVTYTEVLPYIFSPEFQQFIEAFQPELVYSVLGNYRIVKLVRDISHKYHIPILPHFMDDWITTCFSDNKYHYPVRLNTLREVGRLFKDVSCGLTISAAMAEEYSARFDLPFYPFMNCVKTSEVTPVVPDAPKRYVLVYSGGLHLFRWQALLLVSQAVEMLAGKGIDIQLDVYTGDHFKAMYGSAFEGCPRTHFHGLVSHDEMMKRLAASYIVVHVESFDKTAKNYTRLSISTKIPEYMAAAKPILAIGPDDVASIRYITGTNSGINGGDSPEIIAENIEILVQNQEAYRSYALNGWRTAKTNHDAITQQNDLHDIINRLVNENAVVCRQS